MSNPWFRLYSEIVDDEKLRLLAFEDRWHYVALLCCKCKGILDGDGREMMLRKVAVKTGLQVRELDEVARRLDEVGLIDRETLQPTGWDGRQFVSDSSTQRVQKHRAKERENKETNQRNNVKQPCNADETLQERFCNAPDTDTDTDKREAKASSSELADATSDRAGDGGDYSPEKPGIPPCPHQDIIALYHQILPELPSVIPSRWPGSEGESQLRTRWREDQRHRDLLFWENFFRTVRTSRHWMGENDREWRADLRWLIRRKNFDKAVERLVDNLNRGREG